MRVHVRVRVCVCVCVCVHVSVPVPVRVCMHACVRVTQSPKQTHGNQPRVLAGALQPSLLLSSPHTVTYKRAALLPQRAAWEDIRSRLSDGGAGSSTPSGSGSGCCCRLLANLGQSPPTTPGQAGRWQPEAYTTLRAYEALEAAFEGESARDCCVPPGGSARRRVGNWRAVVEGLLCKCLLTTSMTSCPKPLPALSPARECPGEVSLMTVGGNTLALTGPLPSPEEWPGRLPAALREQLLFGLDGCAAGGAGGGGPQGGCWARDVYPLQRVVVDLSLW